VTFHNIINRPSFSSVISRRFVGPGEGWLDVHLGLSLEGTPERLDFTVVVGSNLEGQSLLIVLIGRSRVGRKGGGKRIEDGV